MLTETHSPAIILYAAQVRAALDGVDPEVVEELVTRPIEEAISSAGGIALSELDPQLMLRKLPGLFCAGEMLDWEAPTGGYLLTGCFATGYQAARGIDAWLRAHP